MSNGVKHRLIRNLSVTKAILHWTFKISNDVKIDFITINNYNYLKNIVNLKIKNECE